LAQYSRILCPLSHTASFCQAHVDRSLAGAAAAVRAHDAAARRAALPAEGQAAQLASREIFTGLAHYSWQELSFSATAIGGIKSHHRSDCCCARRGVIHCRLGLLAVGASSRRH